ncbi:hypothetical protein EYF80_045354 [Liparis tanakae]|uniref:Uncharacterized protein n=1 Tax=Liparis tanakae TaxID=230148 RepID=A0A4Z2FTC0_9TELE|nr:hypothetical protein EYF80_045354 [Liparis tanakae]
MALTLSRYAAKMARSVQGRPQRTKMSFTVSDAMKSAHEVGAARASSSSHDSGLSVPVERGSGRLRFSVAPPNEIFTIRGNAGNAEPLRNATPVIYQQETRIKVLAFGPIAGNDTRPLSKRFVPPRENFQFLRRSAKRPISSTSADENLTIGL